MYNEVVYEKFLVELRRMIKKYEGVEVRKYMKHLFHGTSNTEPSFIYKSENGFDSRFSKPGLYGTGIYFANAAGYSLNYVHRNKEGFYQMIYGLVLVGDSTTARKNNDIKMPPLKPNSEIERFDAIRDENSGHYIVYDNLKAYPAYIITF